MFLFRPIHDVILMPEAIVQHIEKKILWGQLKPNSVLLSKNELVKQFRVSRNTVREGLKMLKASGIIKIKHPH
jgi:DNA-binding FadR family transcriptional regulator